MSPLFSTLAVCIGSAALEGLCAGSGVKSFFASLRQPKFSPPLFVWYVIGIGYYATFGIILYRLFARSEPSRLAEVAVGLVVLMMLANALWNLLFFRARNLWLAFITSSTAPIPDVALWICLLRLDAAGAVVLVPYLVYRAYAVWWGYAFWVANR
jgi:tryptophan-rich sensory protein